MSFAFDGVVRFTRIGTIYLLTTFILAVSAINTGNNALYIGVALMLGSLLLSGIASKGGLKHLHAEIAGIDEAWAGRTVDGTLRVRNRSKIWNVRDIVITSPDLANAVYIPILPRRQEVAVQASFLFQRRGVAELKSIDSYTRYPFGFFLKKRRLRVHSEVIVYPRLLPDDGTRERFQAAQGELNTSNRPGQGTEIHSFRDYARGDSMRQIYWKKSASLGRWIVRQTEAESARSVHVVVDPYRPRGVTVDAFEEMISEAATFIHDASADGFDVTLSLPRVDVHARERQSVSPLFRALALLDAVYEPVDQIVDRNAVFFSAAGGRDDAKSA